MRDMIDNDYTIAHEIGTKSRSGAVTPRRDGGFMRIRPGVRVSALALWKETAPPD
jgi:hypothetical protein